jgi:hypothetical protein
VGALAAQQLVEDDPQRVDIGGGGHRLVEELLGGCVLGGQQPDLGARQHGRQDAARLPPHDLGDAEVQQLHRAFRRDQDVAGLEIAMDHQVAVGELHRRADRPEEPQPLRHRERALVAEAIQREAVHVFHGEPGVPLVGHPAVDEPRNAGVIQPRQDLPLGLEAPDEALGVHARPDQLQRNEPLDGFGLLGAVDHAHAAFAQRLEQAVASDLLGGAVGRQLGNSAADLVPQRAAAQDRSWRLGEGQQRVDLGAQRRVAGTGLLEERGSLGRREGAGGEQDFLDARVALVGHGAPGVWRGAWGGMRGAHDDPSRKHRGTQ